MKNKKSEKKDEIKDEIKVNSVEKRLSIPETVLKSIMAYLLKRPAGEVFDIIQNIQSNTKNIDESK